MAHTFTSLYYHIIFSTKDRIKCISPNLKSDLYSYMGGIVREIGGKSLETNGTWDHVHLLSCLPAKLSISEFLRVLKTNSSKWVHEQRRIPRAGFGWQTGYAAFSVSKSKISIVSEYIRNQEKHHSKVSFQEEFVKFLKEHGHEYDERYLWE